MEELSNFEPKEQKARFAELLEIVSKIETIGESSMTDGEILKESKVLVRELLYHLDSDLHLELSADVTTIYNEMNKENLLARVESIIKVVECITGKATISVGNNESHYANSVTANPEGLRIAMAEGSTLGPVRLLVGLDINAMVGFTDDHLEVSEIDDSEFDLRDTGIRKAYCRHVKGEIHKDDIRYVVIRIPRKFFPIERMNEEESQSKGNFIFRGARIPMEFIATEEEMSKAA